MFRIILNFSSRYIQISTVPPFLAPRLRLGAVEAPVHSLHCGGQPRFGAQRHVVLFPLPQQAPGLAALPVVKMDKKEVKDLFIKHKCCVFESQIEIWLDFGWLLKNGDFARVDTHSKWCSGFGGERKFVETTKQTILTMIVDDQTHGDLLCIM